MKFSSNKLFFIGLLMGMLFLAGCRLFNRAEKLAGVVVINVLDKHLYEDCHIRGSINVPFQELEEYAKQHLDRNADIILYCSNYMCSASGHGVKQLKALGFQQVAAYEGGTAEWYQNNLPVEGPCTAEYLRKKSVAAMTDEATIDIISMDDLARKLRVIQ